MPSSRESITASPSTPKRRKPEYASKPPVPSPEAQARAGLSPTRRKMPSLPPSPRTGVSLLGGLSLNAFSTPSKGSPFLPPPPTRDSSKDIALLTQRIQDLTLELQQLKSSVASNPLPSSSTSSSDALNSLVTLLADKEARELQRESQRETDRKEEKLSRKWRDMHNLIKAAPVFDGSGDVDFWVNEMQLYLGRHSVNDKVTQNHVLIGAMTGPAREWFGSLPDYECDKSELADVLAAVIGRYGKTKMQKLRVFEAIKQKSGESLSAYADRLRKACYGLNKDIEEIIHKFYKSILVSSHVYDDVINLPCESLQKAVEYVEQHSRGRTTSFGDKSSLRCSICKRTGHTSKTCRQKGRTS